MKQRITTGGSRANYYYTADGALARKQVTGDWPSLPEIEDAIVDAMYLTAAFLVSDCGQMILAGIGLAATLLPGGGATLVAIQVGTSVTFGLIGDAQSKDGYGAGGTFLESTALVMGDKTHLNAFTMINLTWDIRGCAEEVTG